jgi:hypothetical protein
MKRFQKCLRIKGLWSGRVAQLGEHLLCKQGVAGSIPATSTNFSFLRAVAPILYAPQPRMACRANHYRTIPKRNKLSVDFIEGSIRYPFLGPVFGAAPSMRNPL